MISLKHAFNRESLNSNGARLSKIVREKIINSDRECTVDFDGIHSISAQFFQDFIFPLVVEFGSQHLDKKLRFVNLKTEHLASYRAACEKTSDYIDLLAKRDRRLFGEISDLTLELLIKARELSRTNRSAAQLIFGINSGMAESISKMDIETIRRVSNAGIICFEPRFTPEFAAKMAALDASEVDIFLNVVGGLEDVYETRYL